MSRRTSRSEGTVVERRKPARLRWPYLIVAALMVLFAYKFVQKTHEIRQLNVQAAALRYANRQTAEDNARLQRAIRYYRTTGYLEEEARSTLGYTKPGELTVMSTPKYRPVAPALSPGPRVRANPEPAWRQWWKAFFG